MKILPDEASGYVPASVLEKKLYAAADERVTSREYATRTLGFFDSTFRHGPCKLELARTKTHAMVKMVTKKNVKFAKGTLK